MTTETLAAPAASTESTAPAATTTETTAPVDMADTIRGAYREMTKSGEAPVETTEEAPAETVVEEPAAPATTGQQPRDAQGRFLKADGTVDEVATAAAAKPAAPVTPPVNNVVDGVDLTKPPTSLKGAVQAKWMEYPPEVRAEFHRREVDFHKGLAANKQAAENFRAVDEKVQPYAKMIRDAGLTVPQVIDDFLSTASVLRTGTPEAKTQLIAQIARQYGVDVAQLPAVTEQLPPAAAPPDPKLVALEGQLRTTNERLESFQQEQARREQQALDAEVQTFAQKPEHKHYETVKLVMAALIQNGQAVDLKDAYDKATWANPDVRALLIAEQQEVERKQKAEKAAQARKAASPNVAPRGSLPAAPVVGTMDDTIRQEYRRITAGK